MRFADHLREMRIAAYVREGLPVRMIVNRFGENARPVAMRVMAERENNDRHISQLLRGGALASVSPSIAHSSHSVAGTEESTDGNRKSRTT